MERYDFKEFYREDIESISALTGLAGGLVGAAGTLIVGLLRALSLVKTDAALWWPFAAGCSIPVLSITSYLISRIVPRIRYSGEIQAGDRIENNKLAGRVTKQHEFNEKDNYTEYIIVDNFDNYYTIKENGIMDYTILLDNYTIKTEEFITTYNKASDAKKVATDIEIFIKMINNKDYKNAYECLSSEFKQNYFKTIDEFKNYVQKNFYDTNYITIKNVQTKSNVYTCTANIKSGVGVAADDMDKNFIIKLNPNAEFELSFEVE